MASLLAEPQLALLPNRTRWLRLHCADLERCDTCLGRVACFLADEMAYELDDALERTAESYRAELGAEHCSLERARELRRMTCRACVPSIWARAWVLADEDGVAAVVETETRTAMRPRALKFGLVWVGLFFLLGLAVWW